MILYSLRCTWWSSDTGKYSGRVTCPKCRARLERMERKEWQEGIEHGLLSDPLFEKYIAWVRDKCYPTHKYARLQYGLHRKVSGCRD